MKYSIKERLEVETSQATEQFLKTLTSSVTTSHFDGYADRFILDHGECFTILELAVEERETIKISSTAEVDLP